MLWDILTDFVAYNVGYGCIKLVTGGRRPEKYLKDGGSVGIELLGLGVIVAVIAVFVLLLRG